ncbi:MAG: accessory factor UbiK family protein [Pseudomonadota bacterium]
MTHTNNRLLDEFAKLMTDAAGVAQGVQREVETVVRTQAERFLADMDIVQREEFEAVKEMASKARSENADLKARIEELEALVARLSEAPAKRSRAKAPAKSKPASA